MLVECAAFFTCSCYLHDGCGEDGSAAEATFVVDEDGDGSTACSHAYVSFNLVGFLPICTCSLVTIVEMNSVFTLAGVLQSLDYCR